MFGVYLTSSINYRTPDMHMLSFIKPKNMHNARVINEYRIFVNMELCMSAYVFAWRKRCEIFVFQLFPFIDYAVQLINSYV